MPWALVVTAVAVVASRVLDLEAHGVAVIADVPGGLPTPALPGIGMSQMGALSGGAIALALVALAESIGTARSLAAQRGYEIDPNQELVALGAANVGAGVLQGFPVDASLSRSAVGAGAGVRTRLSGLFVALLIVATMLFLTPLFDGLPQATLAAIIIAAVIGLVDVSGFRWLWRIDQADARLAIVGFAAVALLGVLPGIVVAVACVAARPDPARLPAADLRPRPRSPTRRAPTRTTGSAASTGTPSTRRSRGSSSSGSRTSCSSPTRPTSATRRCASSTRRIRPPAPSSSTPP